MRATVIHEHGDAAVFSYIDVPAPICPPKGIVIRVEAISVEGGDLLDRSGNLGPLAKAPYVVGRQAAGEIVEIGDEVRGLALGQKVVGARPNGSYAALFAVSARTVWPIPEGLDVMRAAAVPIAFASAFDALIHSAGMKQGESVLIHAGCGGVGIAAVQIARRHGASLVLATGSSDERLARLGPLGLDGAINHRRSDVVAEAMRLTGGKGVDVVVDTVGGPALQQSVDCLAEGGRAIMLGQASRAPAVVDIANLIPRRGVVIGFRLDIAGERVGTEISALLAACRDGLYQVIIDRAFPLAEAAAAHRHVESRGAFGRVILIP